MVKVKTAKKQWYSILAPKQFRNIVLGETLVYDPEKIVGKGITQNLMNLTHDVKRQNINIKFEVVNIEDGKAMTNMTGYNMVQSSIKRLARRNINKIDMSFTCTTSDKRTLRLKPILITRAATANSIGSKLRKYAEEFLTKSIANMTYETFTNELIGHKLQSTLKAHLKKIYPLRICEIRSMQVSKVRTMQEGSKNLDKTKKVKVEKKVEEKPTEELKKVAEEKTEEKVKEPEAQEQKAEEKKESDVKEQTTEEKPKLQE